MRTSPAGIRQRVAGQLCVDRAAEAAGVSTVELSAHSLRAGYITTAAKREHSERAISRVSRYKSVPVLRATTVWTDTAKNLRW